MMPQRGKCAAPPGLSDGETATVSRERRRVALAARAAVEAVSEDLTSNFIVLESKVNHILDLLVNEKVHRDEQTQERIHRLETLLVLSPAVGPSVDEVLTQMMERKTFPPVLEPEVCLASMVPEMASRHVPEPVAELFQMPFVPKFQYNEEKAETDKKAEENYEEKVNDNNNKEKVNDNNIKYDKSFEVVQGEESEKVPTNSVESMTVQGEKFEKDDSASLNCEESWTVQVEASAGLATKESDNVPGVNSMEVQSVETMLVQWRRKQDEPQFDMDTWMDSVLKPHLEQQDERLNNIFKKKFPDRGNAELRAPLVRERCRSQLRLVTTSGACVRLAKP